MDLHPLPALGDNYIWLVRSDAGVLVVDPGDAGPVLAAADAGGFAVDTVLLTHHHHDHIGGTARLQARWPDIEVHAPRDDRITLATRRVGDGDTVRAAGLVFNVMEVPGHTTSHIAFFCDAGTQSLLFCGDTLFSLGCGRLFEGSAAQMHDSLSRLAALPGLTRVCCGHEYTMSNAAFARVVDPDNPALRRRSEEAKAMRDAARPTLPTTLAEERACNPFLRCDQPAVAAAVERHAGEPLADATAVFAGLRRWKDGFAG